MPTPDPATAPTPHLPVRPDWLAKRQEDILEPALPIVDPHHHLVDRANTGRYLMPDLLADTGSGHNITATVYLEWLSMYRAGGAPHAHPPGAGGVANGGPALARPGPRREDRVCPRSGRYAGAAPCAAGRPL